MQWEYRQETVNASRFPDLNSLGADGWELCAVIEMMQMAIFKRPKVVLLDDRDERRLF